MLRSIKYLVALVIALVIALATVVLVAGLESEPLVPLSGTLTPADMERARALLKQYDPRAGDADGVRSLEVPARDLALILTYGIGRFVPAGAEVKLLPGTAVVSLTGQVPDNPLGAYLNLRFDLSQIPGEIQIDGLHIGGLQLPGWLANGIGWSIHKALQGDETYQAAIGSISGFRFAEDRLVVVYRWQSDLVEQVKSRGKALLIAEADRERLLAYAERIAAVTRAGQRSRKLPLVDMMSEVFQLAWERTGAQDAATENRAAIIALMFYVQGVDIPRLLDEPADSRFRTEPRKLVLQGRVDFAQHFLISAGIAAAGGSQLADAVGLYKEVDDSRGGSGFSFTDLAADRSGVRFAETATGSNASRVQALLAEDAEEALFMPEARDLPEFMSEAEFMRRYGGVGEPAYQKVADAIERRIDALDIHL